MDLLPNECPVGTGSRRWDAPRLVPQRAHRERCPRPLALVGSDPVGVSAGMRDLLRGLLWQDSLSGSELGTGDGGRPALFLSFAPASGWPVQNSGLVGSPSPVTPAACRAPSGAR